MDRPFRSRGQLSSRAPSFTFHSSNEKLRMSSAQYEPLALEAGEDDERFIYHKYNGPLHRSRRHLLALLTRYAIGGATLVVLVWVASFVVPNSWLPKLIGPNEEFVDGVDIEFCAQPPTNAAWNEALDKARSHLKDWTLEDKVNLATGVGWQNGPCVGNIPAIEKRGWKGLCLQDSPLGVRMTDGISAFPAGINVAATFNRKLMRARGAAMAHEFRGKGAHVFLGPMMNLARAPDAGRNWEGSGPDPYLTGEASYETIVGMQAIGVQACAKHFLNNEQEWARTTSSSNNRELYIHPFLRSVQAGVVSVMCSYNQLNGTYTCEHDGLLQTVLKHELGFKGYVMSDWQATMSTHSAQEGLDMSMPGDIKFFSGDSYFGKNLTKYIMDGKMPQSRLDDMATRILGAWYLMGQDKDFPEVNFESFHKNTPTDKHVDVQGDHYKLVREIGAKSTVLLKNKNDALPFKTPRSIALIGQDAGPARRGPNGIKNREGIDGVLGMGWGSGCPLEAIQARARQAASNSSISWFLEDNDLEGAKASVAGRDVAIVFIAADSGEERFHDDGSTIGDRHNLTAFLGGDVLVQAVASVHSNVIVVVHTVGPIIVEPWVSHANVTALVWAGLPGQEAGNSLADVLWGDVNPSGRLPYTIAKNEGDYSARVNWGNGTMIIYSKFLTKKARLNVDYRHFDANKIEPRFAFGFGLSYTTFKYSDLEIDTVGTESGLQATAWRKGLVKDGKEFGAHVAPWLHEPHVRVSFKLENNGSLAGTEIPQLYLSMPSSTHSPPNILRGFDAVPLAPGEARTIIMALSRYDLSIWDVRQQGWVLPPGAIGVRVGSSSRDFKLGGDIRLYK
ncbi:beta-glucosidase [Auriculariales sp. MPI-PUGE-AT-0066]|nr:beta-glucosidase [Auriculariales sp. MPI-PUGE-AT-0066]